MTIIYKEIILEDSIKNNYTLKYYLLENNLHNITTYGIKIEKLNNNILDEVEEVSSITDNLDFAKEIFNKIIKNTVTPITLIYILDDLISQYC